MFGCALVSEGRTFRRFQLALEDEPALAFGNLVVSVTVVCDSIFKTPKGIVFLIGFSKLQATVR